MRNERATSRFKMRQRLQSAKCGKRIRRPSWLSITNLSHASQVGLLILACYGYLYTVRPVYTKALLEENIAKYEMELPKLKENNSELKNMLRISNEELVDIRKQVDHEKKELEKLRKELRSTSMIISRQSSKIAQGKEELFEQYQTLRFAVLSSVKVTMETQCYFFLTNASRTGVFDEKLVDSVSSCLRNSPEQATHFMALSIRDKEEIRNQTQTLSARIAKTGARVLAEQASQEKNMKAESTEQQIAEIQRQSKRIKVLMTEVIEGIDSISLSQLNRSASQ